MAKLIKPCNVKGCCLTGIHVPLTTTEIIPNGASSLVVAANATTTVVNELCQTVYQLPGSVLRLASDVWAHVKKEPKKPTWNIQTTIVMGFLQAFRDQSLTNSLEFWRLMLIAPTFITPLTSKTEQLTIPIKRRGLCGILRKADQEESGNRTLDSEWMSAVSTWEKIYGGPSRPRPTSSGLLLEAPPSCEKIVLYFHGGAYCAMSAQTHRTLTHKISKATNRRVLAVNYSLSPEVKFPGALYDAVQSFLFMIDPKGPYKLDPKNVLVMGDSAGGGLCLAMMLYLRDHGLAQPEGAALLSPWVDLSFSYPSWKNASLYDYLPDNPGELKAMNPAHLYLDSPHLVRHPYVSPIFADNFDNMPPILIQSGGCESLRDEIVDLTEKMRKSKGTMVHHEIYEDMVHVFQAFPFSKSSEAIERIGWWAKLGIPLIRELQSRHPIQHTDTKVGSCEREQNLPPLLLGRRHRSIPC